MKRIAVWFIRIAASAVGIVAILYWASMLMAGLTMGWSYRTDLQIAGLILLITISVVGSFWLSVLAITAINEGRFNVALRSLISSLVPIPLAWWLIEAGLFAP